MVFWLEQNLVSRPVIQTTQSLRDRLRIVLLNRQIAVWTNDIGNPGKHQPQELRDFGRGTNRCFSSMVRV